jgi:phospholipid/cholesterol/gamma-HCH transport system ATP-binding protein
MSAHPAAGHEPKTTKDDEIVLRVRDVSNHFGEQVVHDKISFDVKRGEILGLVGGSGAGKSVMLRSMTGLHIPNSGSIEINGRKLARIKPAERAHLFGVLFQEGALFSSLTVAQNIMFAIAEHTHLSRAHRAQLAALKLALVGLEPEVGDKRPSELSGGMVKRASLARALALDPEILFLDEPTAGLDPLSASAFDAMIIELNRTLGVTIVMVTHDLDTLFSICDRVAVLVDRKVTIDPLETLIDNQNQWIHDYFNGPRAKGAAVAAKEAGLHG